MGRHPYVATVEETNYSIHWIKAADIFFFAGKAAKDAQQLPEQLVHDLLRSALRWGLPPADHGYQANGTRLSDGKIIVAYVPLVASGDRLRPEITFVGFVPERTQTHSVEIR